MKITPSISGGNVRVIDSVMADSYNRNAGLALDANLTLMLRCEAHMPASVLERGAAQARVRVETRGPHLTTSASDKGREVRV